MQGWSGKIQQVNATHSCAYTNPDWASDNLEIRR
jgi:hypothetical protein